MLKPMNKKLKKQLYQIAAQCMVTIEGRGDLECRGNDEEDFVDVSVGSIEAALQMAYELGLKDAKEARQNVA